MLRTYEQKDYAAVLALWQEAFGDTKEDIDACLQHFAPYLTVYTSENAPCGMCMLLPLQAGNKSGYYIYAVATDKRFRAQGIATKLLDYAKARIKSEDKDFLALVPAKPDLFEFYKKRGFIAGAPLKKQKCTFPEQPAADAGLQQITPAQYGAMRATFFKNVRLAAWSEEMLCAIDSLYGGCFYALTAQDSTAICMAYATEEKVIAAELCTSAVSVDRAAKALCAYFDRRTIELAYPSADGDNFAMFYPHEHADLYFNLAIN